MNSPTQAPESLSNTSRKKPFLSYLRDIAIVMVVVSAIIFWQTKDMLQADGSVKVQQQNLVTLDGSIAPLLARDKPNLLYFFAPWCTVCDLSIDNLAYLNDEKVNVVVIALDYRNKEEVAEFINKNQVIAPVMFGHEDLKNQFQIKGYPSYYLVDENQMIVSKAYGYSTAIGLKLRETFGI